MLNQSKIINVIDSSGKSIKIEYVYKTYLSEFDSTYLFYKKQKSNVIEISKFDEKQNKLYLIKKDNEWDKLDEVFMQFIKENKKI